MAAWNGWYHVMANTYGTWPPGDPRGFRTRHHREHVEGDYKHPPTAGAYDDRRARSRTLMKREPVILTPAARLAAVEALVHALREVHGLEVLACAVSGCHLHVLLRLPQEVPAAKPTP